MGAKAAYMELRGLTGAGAVVLQDGTLVSLDFASGEIVFRLASGGELRVHRDQLPPDARAQFIQLASRVAANPLRSLEAGTGLPPPSATAPVQIPRWGYPLRDSMFAFGGRVFPKNGESEEESPCAEDPSACRPPVMLERIEVTGFSINGSSSSDRFDMWWARNSEPRPVLSPTDLSTMFEQWYLERNRADWEQWRQRRCADVDSAVAAAGVATIGVAGGCATVWTVAGGVVCAASVIGLMLAMNEQADATADCLGPYPGPGGWP
jgi:hypothetical protein